MAIPDSDRSPVTIDVRIGETERSVRPAETVVEARNVGQVSRRPTPFPAGGELVEFDSTTVFENQAISESKTTPPENSITYGTN